MSLRILQITNKLPYPPVDGGNIGIYTITTGLIEAGCSLKMLAMNTTKHYIDINSIPADFRQQTALQTVTVDNRVKPIPAFLNLFSSESYNIIRFNSPQFAELIRQSLQNEVFDIVHLDSLYLTPYVDLIKKHTTAKIVLRAHNIEHRIWERAAQSCRNPLKKLYLTHLAKKLRNYELSHINDFHGIAAVSGYDAQELRKMGCTIPIKDIPVPYQIKNSDINDEVPDYTILFHIGAMDWLPNIEGIEWFLSQVWPEVLKKYPDVKLHLAGRKMSEKLMKLKIPSVTMFGEVQDAQEFISKRGIMIVPLLAGGGIRVKILEGLAMGKTIISTRIGAEGILCSNNENILLADTPEEFVEQIGKCLQSQDFCKRVGENARKLFTEKYERKKIIQDLINFYQELIVNDRKSK